jgi:hypothetical protein
MGRDTGQHHKPTRDQYRTASLRHWDDRRLLLRGGELDGQYWVGPAPVGDRVFCGQGPWRREDLYLVTDQDEIGDDGSPVTIAVPVFAQ